MLNCKKTIEQLYPYLDRELTAEELKDVQEHLDMCPPCAKHFAFESGMLRIISAACRSVEAPVGLKARILSARSYVSEIPPTK